MLELYLLNAIRRITNSNYPRAAKKILLRVAESISIAIKGKRKILLMEICPTDAYLHNCEIFREGRPTHISHDSYIYLSLLKKRGFVIKFLGPQRCHFK